MGAERMLVQIKAISPQKTFEKDAFFNIRDLLSGVILKSFIIQSPFIILKIKNNLGRKQIKATSFPTKIKSAPPKERTEKANSLIVAKQLLFQHGIEKREKTPFSKV